MKKIMTVEDHDDLKKIETIKDMFWRLAKAQAGKYIVRKSRDGVYSVKSLIAIRQAYLAGAHHGWKSRSRAKIWE